jgi:hypothetical protein
VTYIFVYLRHAATSFGRIAPRWSPTAAGVLKTSQPPAACPLMTACAQRTAGGSGRVGQAALGQITLQADYLLSEKNLFFQNLLGK